MAFRPSKSMPIVSGSGSENVDHVWPTVVADDEDDIRTRYAHAQLAYVCAGRKTPGGSTFADPIGVR
jgi:hypothetical protein